MRYLVVQDWDNTHGNHAGMVHMCNLLCEKYPEKYRIIVKESRTSRRKPANNLLHKVFNYVWSLLEDYAFKKSYITLVASYVAKLKEGDAVYLLEYNLPLANQYTIARYIKRKTPFVKIYALSHLTPSWFDKRKMREMILKWDRVIDKHLTLGTSLTNYFISIGIDKNKISTGFHYVDSSYYNTDKYKELHNPLTVITIGAQQRDYSLLASVVENTPGVNWIICKGKKNVENLFAQCNNVMLLDYIEEDLLKYYMSGSDISLSIMDDTVGSNVITTSMSMGLAIVVSDVGSIHDYCTTDNAVFCNNTADSFVDAIRKLAAKRERVIEMKCASYNKSRLFEISRIDEWFSSLSVK